MAATEPIRDKKQVQALSAYFLKKGQIRNCVLILMGVHTALRVSDLLRLRVGDVYDFERGRVREALTLTEKKTGKSKTVALNAAAVRALSRLIGRTNPTPDAFLFANPRTGRAISRIQAYRIVRAAAEALGMGRVSCHSLRKTFGYHAWKSGVSPVLIMDIYNHSSFAVTRRYLGVAQEDRNGVYLKLRFTA